MMLFTFDNKTVFMILKNIYKNFLQIVVAKFDVTL